MLAKNRPGSGYFRPISFPPIHVPVLSAGIIFIQAFCKESEYPHTNCTVEAVGDRSATVKLQVGVNHLRPGGTVSGPVLITVADVALYVEFLAKLASFPSLSQQT
jgi:hypothetical protein